MIVADTSPLNYLIQIDAVDALARLYGTISIPTEVLDELSHPGAPVAVGRWIRQRPGWLRVIRARSFELPDLSKLDAGELAAIQLAQAEPRSLLIIDDANGRKAADRLGVQNIGTLGILRLAALKGFVDLRVALEKLTHTSFRTSSLLIGQLIAEYEELRRGLQR